MSDNIFPDRIPEMEILEVLDLPFNDLYGTIPQSLTSAHSYPSSVLQIIGWRERFQPACSSYSSCDLVWYVMLLFVESRDEAMMKMAEVSGKRKWMLGL